MGNQTIFTTIVGSNCWGTADEHSDTDLFTVYVGDTKDVLLGKDFKSKFESNVNYDLSTHEIGHVCKQLMKSNINFIVGTMSPVIVATSGWHQKLREIIIANPSYKIYDSIAGMAVSNMDKYIYSEKDNSDKRRIQIMRVLQFGIAYFERTNANYAYFEFPIKNFKYSIEDIEIALVKLESLYEASKDLPMFSGTFLEAYLNDYLFDIRNWNYTKA